MKGKPIPAGVSGAEGITGPMPDPPPPSISPPVAEAEWDRTIPGLSVKHTPLDPGWPLTIYAGEPQEDWVVTPVTREDVGSVFVVPTTLLYRGRAWRIHEAVETSGGWAYRLRPCPEGEPQICKVELSRDARLRAEGERLAFERERRKAHASAWYDWALGWLPAELQEALSSRWGFSVQDASRRNARLLFFVFLIPSIIQIALMLGGALAGAGGPVSPIGMLFPALFLESFLRWQHLAASEGAFGFAPLEAIYWLAVRLGRRRPEAPR